MKHRDNRFIDLMRSTLERVESSEAAQDKQDAVGKLRRSVVRIIADRELRNSTSDSQPINAGTKDSAA